MLSKPVPVKGTLTEATESTTMVVVAARIKTLAPKNAAFVLQDGAK